MKSLYSQILLLHELKVPVKKVYIFMSTKLCTRGCYTVKTLFAVKNDASKIIRNMFFTHQPEIFKIVYNLPKWVK